MSNYIWSLVRFALLSLFSFFMILGLTTLSVQVFGWQPILAHILTLIAVMMVNAWLLIVFVFPSDTLNRRLLIKAYVSSTLILRLVEWLVFALLVSKLEWDYRLSIVIVNPTFVLIKFRYLRARAHTPTA